MKKIDYLLLFLILSLTFLLGSRMILSGDFFYLFDQARDYLIVKDIVTTHTLALIGTHSGLGGFFHGPIWLYMLIPAYIIGHGNPLAFAYFYIFLQVITITAAFLCGLKLYSAKGGLVIALLVALSPVTWNTVPNTIGANVLPLIFVGFIYFLVKFVRGDQNSFIFVAFLTGFSLQFETSLPLILIPSVLAIFIINRIALRNVRIILLSFCAFMLSISNFILFDLRHKFLMTNALLGAFGKKDRGYIEWNNRLSEHLNSLIDTYKNLLFKPDNISIFLLVTIFAIGIIQIFRNKKLTYRKEYFYLLFFPLLIFSIFILYPYKIWPEYVFELIIPLSITLFLSIRVIWAKKYGRILTTLFVIITLFNVGASINSQYFTEYKDGDSAGSYKNQQEIAEWIFRDKKEGEFGYLVYTPETYTHGMDYLMWWNGTHYPGILPHNIKLKTTYLILYPHLADDKNAHNFWKINVARINGKVISKKIFKGNIIVEKLLIDKKEPEVDPNYYQGLLFR